MTGDVAAATDALSTLAIAVLTGVVGGYLIVLFGRLLMTWAWTGQHFWTITSCVRCGTELRSDTGELYHCLRCLIGGHTQDVVLTAVYPGADRISRSGAA